VVAPPALIWLYVPLTTVDWPESFFPQHTGEPLPLIVQLN
jgi:hypothetical protein